MDVPISLHTHFSDAYVNRFVDKFGQASSSMFQGCLHFHGLPVGRQKIGLVPVSLRTRQAWLGVACQRVVFISSHRFAWLKDARP